MAKLIMLSGLPASGKSTKAKEIIEEYGNFVRVNKDLLRTMLHFDRFTGRNAGLVIDAEKALAKYFLENEVNVVVDDTNLGEKYEQFWKQLCKDINAKFEKLFIDTPMEECILRDLDREKPVGVTVIKNFALANGLAKPQKKWVLCDLDGTIADISHRLPFVKQEPKDWKTFFSLIPNDKVRLDVKARLDAYREEGYEIIFISARPETHKELTIEWLQNNGLSFGWTLIMRRKDDHRVDSEVKQSMLETYFPDKTLIHAVIDDRPSVIRMWQANGLDVVDVGSGVEF